MKKLDRSKPFDELFGFGENGERYKQDGVYFTHDGEEVIVGRAPAAEAQPSVEEAPAAKPSLEELASGKKRGKAKTAEESAEDLV